MKPPELYDLDAERAVLGAMLIDPEAYTQIMPILHEGDFWRAAHQALYRAILACAGNGGIDVIAVCDALTRDNSLEQVGGMPYLTELINATPSAVYADNYAQIVADFARRRALLVAASDIAKTAYQLDIVTPEVQAQAEARVLACRTDNGNHRYSAHEAASAAFDALYKTQPLTSGIPDLDALLGGLEPAVYIIAARPSVGKSALLAQMAMEIARSGARVALFSIEMSAAQVVGRMAVTLSGTTLRSIRDHSALPDQVQAYTDALGQIATWPLTIIDRSELRAPDVLAECHRQQVEHGSLAVAIVDGLWLMQPTQKYPTQLAAIGEISRSMKRVQRDLGIPILMAHQLNRACELRADKRPILSDLRETGEVEQDPDVVIMMYRAGYYDPRARDANVMELWVRKNRLGGPAGVCARLYWHGARMRCDPLAHE